MASDWDERGAEEKPEEAEVGILGGGGPAETMGEAGEEEADERGERLRAPEDDS